MSNQQGNAIPKRSWRWKRPLQLLVVLFGLLVLAWLLLVPRLVRAWAANAIEETGLHPVTMDLPEVGLFSAQTKYFMAGPQPSLTVGRVWISYTPLGLLRGKVKHVELQGVDLSLPLPRDARKETATTTPAGSPTPSPERAFEHLTIKDGRLHLPSQRGVVSIPVEVQAAPQGSKSFDLKISARVAGTDVSISATTDAAFEQFGWSLSASKIPAAAIEPWTGKGPLQVGLVDLKAAGNLDVSGAPSIEVASLEAAAPLVISGATGHPLSAELQLNAAGILTSTADGWDIATADGLRFRIDKVSLLEDLPPVSIWSRFAPMQLHLRSGIWNWQGQGAHVGVSSTQVEVLPWQLASGASGLTGGFRGELRETDLRKNRALERFVPRLTPWNLSGKLTADAQVQWQDGRFSSAGHFHLWDGAMVNTQYELSVNRVESQVELTQLWPLRMAPAQSLSMGYAQIGKWEIVDLATRFSAAGNGKLLIESGKLGWAGGQLWCEPFELSMSDWVIRTTLSGRDLQLGKILWVLSNEKAYGEGNVQLQVPVTYKWPQIRFGEGYAEAAKGSVLHLTEPAEQLGKWLTTADPRFGTDPTQMRVRDRILEALREFRLDEFRVDLRRDGQRQKTTVTLRGAGAKGQDPQVVNLNVTANDVDWLLSKYLATKR